jgi:hypothetical protein
MVGKMINKQMTDASISFTLHDGTGGVDVYFWYRILLYLSGHFMRARRISNISLSKKKSFYVTGSRMGTTSGCLLR